jgi:hypothetical protein
MEKLGPGSALPRIPQLDETVYQEGELAHRQEQAEQACLLRNIRSNPFRLLPPRPETIASSAEDIYQGKWELMPLLGEWLQEHGYRQEGEHCLNPASKHVKGCWVIDCITAREMHCERSLAMVPSATGAEVEVLEGVHRGRFGSRKL